MERGAILLSAEESDDVMGSLNIRKRAVLTAMFILCAAQQTRGAGAYLTQTGPPPLRFSLAIMGFASWALPPSLIEHRAPTNTTEIAQNKPGTSGTNALALPTHALPASNNNNAGPPSPDSVNNTVVTPSASDMLVVSPQMLTEYFKPGPDGTNSATTVILPVGFTPPSAKPSSQATYKVQ